MDWQGVVEKQGRMLREVLATLVALAGLRAGLTSPGEGENGSARRGEAETLAERGEGVAPTLPRRTYRAVLRLLRPAEAAARRLIIIAAQGLTVTLPPPRKAKPRKKRRSVYVRPGRGTGIVVPWGVRMPDARPPSRLVSLPLFDPPFRPFNRRRRSNSCTPRILSLNRNSPPPLPSRRASGGQVNASRLGQRIEALGRALENLPKQALRFARWKARRAAGLSRRFSPLRLGRAYALRRTGRGEEVRQVDEILADTHYFARLALNPDTS